jgi:hypothetical protein
MAYSYGEHRYGQYRYSWLTEWEPVVCEGMAVEQAAVITVSPSFFKRPYLGWQTVRIR